MNSGETSIYAWTAEDEEGKEGILGAMIAGHMRPLVYLEEDVARQGIEIAREVMRVIEKPVTLKKFVLEETLCTLELSKVF